MIILHVKIRAFLCQILANAELIHTLRRLMHLQGMT